MFCGGCCDKTEEGNLIFFLKRHDGEKSSSLNLVMKTKLNSKKNRKEWATGKKVFSRFCNDTCTRAHPFVPDEQMKKRERDKRKHTIRRNFLKKHYFFPFFQMSPKKESRSHFHFYINKTTRRRWLLMMLLRLSQRLCFFLSGRSQIRRKQGTCHSHSTAKRWFRPSESLLLPSDTGTHTRTHTRESSLFHCHPPVHNSPSSLVRVDDELLLVRSGHFHLDKLRRLVAKFRLVTKVQRRGVHLPA